jgi:hypothetical protein
MPFISKQHHGGNTLHEIPVPFLQGFQQTEPDVPDPVPCAALVDLSGTQTMLHFGQHLAEDLDGWCPEQWVALGANLDPQLLEHRLLVLLASLVFPQ